MTQAIVTNPLRKSRIVVLDGGLGTEIERTYQKQLQAPLWSAEILCSEPHIIKSIHRAYLDAGADVISTSTYQASVPGFQKIGYSEKESKQILKNSIKLASDAKKEFLQANPSVVEVPSIALSLGAFGACLCEGNELTGDYNGATNDEIYQFHMERINTILQDNEYANDVAILAFETVPRLQEAQLIAEILRNEKIVQGIPAWVSFYANSHDLLPDGNSVFDAVKVIASLNINHTENAVCGVGFNCIQPGLLKPLINEASRCLNELFVGEDSNKPVLIAYPNSGEEYDANGKVWNGSSELPNDMKEYTQITQSWVKETNIGAIGGCCRTCPDHTRALSLCYRKK